MVLDKRNIEVSMEGSEGIAMYGWNGWLSWKEL